MPRPPKPGGPTIEPRSYTSRTKFGRTSTPLSDREVLSPQHGAAEIQHAVANIVREHLLDAGTTLKRFCETNDLPAGLTYDRFQRISRGETMMTLTDLAFWAARIPVLPAALAATLTEVAERTPTPQTDAVSEARDAFPQKAAIKGQRRMTDNRHTL